MSISQIAPFLKGIPKDEPLPNLYFMYGHHFLSEDFQEHLLGATRQICVGFLKDWTWHINEKQVPNIRYSFVHNYTVPEGPLISPATKFNPQATARGTYGLVFELTPKLKTFIEKEHGSPWVPMVLDIQLNVMQANGNSQSTLGKALVYWNPHYTADGIRGNIFTDLAERRMWRDGLFMLKARGVPQIWIYSIQRRLAGEHFSPEPLFSNYVNFPPVTLSGQKKLQQTQHRYRQHEPQPVWQPTLPKMPVQMRPAISLAPRRPTSRVYQESAVQAYIAENREVPPPNTQEDVSPQNIAYYLRVITNQTIAEHNSTIKTQTQEGNRGQSTSRPNPMKLPHVTEQNGKPMPRPQTSRSLICQAHDAIQPFSIPSTGEQISKRWGHFTQDEHSIVHQMQQTRRQTVQYGYQASREQAGSLNQKRRSGIQETLAIQTPVVQNGHPAAQRIRATREQNRGSIGQQMPTIHVGAIENSHLAVRHTPESQKQNGRPNPQEQPAIQARMGEDGRTPQVTSSKRKTGGDDKILLEAVKRMKKDGHS